MIKGVLAGIKPLSMMISVVSVSVGTAVAALHGSVHWLHYVLTLLGSVFLHAGANVINDYFDYEKEIDRRGASSSYATEGRVLVERWLKPWQVVLTASILFALSVPIGLYLTMVKGIPVFVLGFIGFLTGLFYTARPIGLKYLALGEPAVFFMFGPLMVSGAYYVQRGEFSAQALWISLPIGMLVALILLANNIRDLDFDGVEGVRTIAGFLGRRGAVMLYRLLVALAYGVTILLVITGHLSAWSLLTLLSLPVAIKLVGMFRGEVPGDADARTGQLDTVFGFLLVLSISLQRLIG